MKVLFQIDSRLAILSAGSRVVSIIATHPSSTNFIHTPSRRHSRPRHSLKFTLTAV